MGDLIQKLIDDGYFVEFAVFNRNFATLEAERKGWRKSYQGTPGEVVLDASIDRLAHRLGVQDE